MSWVLLIFSLLFSPNSQPADVRTQIPTLNTAEWSTFGPSAGKRRSSSPKRAKKQKTVRVSSYTRKDGTKVRAHYRSRPTRRR